MKIADAFVIYRGNASVLNDKKKTLFERKKEADNKYKLTNDKAYADEAASLQLSLEAVDKAYKENMDIISKLSEQHAAVWNGEVSKQQVEAEEKAAKEQMKVMIVFRRMCHGDIVPGKDERKLMEYDPKMYKVAKQMQAMMQQLEKEKERKKHKSLWEEEEEMNEYDPQGKADNAEVGFDLPDIDIPETAVESSEVDTEVE